MIAAGISPLLSAAWAVRWLARAVSPARRPPFSLGAF